MNDSPSTQPDPEPIQMSSSLPGDAIMDSSPSPSPEPLPSTSLLPTCTPSSSQPPPTASTSSIPYTSPKTHTLTSVSSSDPSKSRSFECRYLQAPTDSSFAAQSSRSFLDLPESYFAPTPVELQQAFAGQVKKREELVDRPLLTQKLRELEEAKKSRAKAAKWPQTRIRIRFSDRSQLEGVFPSTDKLIHLYEFVKLSLTPEHSQTPFILYQSPPRTEYIKGDSKWKGKNLMELEFTPSSALYIKFENDLLNDPSRPPPLRSELIEIASPLPPPPSFDPSEQPKKEEKVGEKRKVGGNGLGGDRGKVVPAWMRLGGKNAKK